MPTDEIKLDEIETRIVGHGLYKFLAEKFATNTPGNDRAVLDDHFRELFEQTGATSIQLRVNGTPVGTYSVVTTKPKKSTTIKVVERDVFIAWCEENGCIICEPDMEKAKRNLQETGVIPDGCSVITIDEPGGEFKHGVLKVDVESVNKALGTSIIPAALMEGDEQ